MLLKARQINKYFTIICFLRLLILNIYTEAESYFLTSACLSHENEFRSDNKTSPLNLGRPQATVCN